MWLGTKLIQRRKIGVSEAVDRLFWISDDEQCARARRADTVTIGKRPDQFHLKRVGVLELVYQDVRISRLEMLAGVVVLQERHCPCQHVVELGPAGVSSLLGVPGNEPLQRPEQIPDGVASPVGEFNTQLVLEILQGRFN